MFMGVIGQILGAALDTLETRKSICHSLVYQAADCAANFNSSHNSNVLYPANSMSKFTMIFHLCLTEGI